jgi:zinc transporter 7
MLVNALLATLFISLLPNLLLVAIPADLIQRNGGPNRLHYQNILLCFAAGGLLGDVFLHIIPHLLMEHGEDGDSEEGAKHRHGSTGGRELWSAAGQSNLPYGSELETNQQMRNSVSSQDHSHDYGRDHLGGSHHHPHESTSGKVHNEHQHQHQHEHHHHHGASNQTGIFVLVGFLSFLILEKLASLRFFNDSSDKKLEDADDHSHSHGHHPSVSSPLQLSKLSPSGMLNLFADSLHNFTDGIAIGASFAYQSQSAIHTASGTTTIAFATLLSVLFHEIPHELGDFSILMENGFRYVAFYERDCIYLKLYFLFHSKWEAIRAQFMTAVAAFVGTYVGYLGRSSKFLEDILMSFTAGGFLYIATVTIIPTIAKQSSASGRSITTSLLQIVWETTAFCLGVGFMVAVTYLE